MSETRCIFCLEVAPATVEHLFAEPVGRVSSAVVTCVCAQCNSTLGTEVDAAADRDEFLSTARHLVGLPLRSRSVAGIDPVPVEGELLRMRIGGRSGAPEVTPQVLGDEIVAGEADIARILREGTASRFRKAGAALPRVELDEWIADFMKAWQSAPVGAILEGTFMGLRMTVPKVELEASVTVRRHAERGATDRLVVKIGLEALALQAGCDLVRDPAFDSARRFARYGSPLCVVETVARPDLERPNATLEHRVCLQNHKGRVRAVVTFLGGYRRRATLGPAVASLNAAIEKIYTVG